MKQLKDSNGFSVPHVLLILLILGIVGFTGWYVWNTNQEVDKNLEVTKSAASTGQSSSKTDTNDSVPKIPEGYMEYKNDVYDFSFAYPAQWGKLESKGGDVNTFVAETPEMDLGSDFIGGKMKVTASKIEAFSMRAGYRSAVVKATGPAPDYRWVVVAPETEGEVHSIGDELSPEPQVIFKKDSLRVYNFPTGHACAEWSSIAFASGDYFIGIELPYVCPDEAKTLEEGDVAYKNYKNSLVKQIAQMVRVSN